MPFSKQPPAWKLLKRKLGGAALLLRVGSEQGCGRGAYTRHICGPGHGRSSVCVCGSNGSGGAGSGGEHTYVRMVLVEQQ